MMRIRTRLYKPVNRLNYYDVFPGVVKEKHYNLVYDDFIDYYNESIRDMAYDLFNGYEPFVKSTVYYSRIEMHPGDIVAFLFEDGSYSADVCLDVGWRSVILK